jgi:arylformamidase
MSSDGDGSVLSFRPGEMIDVTRTLGADTIPWPGAKDYSGIEHDHRGYVITSMRLTAHTGTHMDAPRHRFPRGPAIDEIGPRVLVSRAHVVDCGSSRVIGPGVLDGLDLPGRSVLFRTMASGFDRGGFREDYPYLGAATAGRLRDEGVVLVGIDYLSVDAFDSDDAHDILLGAGMAQVEDLSLGHVAPGEYILFCFPLRIGGCEASPVRAFLAPPAARC